MPEVRLRKIKGVYDWLRLYRLYREAFPASERKPFAVIARMYRQGKADLWCVTKDSSFAGMAATINGEDLILLDYFAVVKSFRGQGVGSEAMALLQEQYRDRGLFVEIESTRRAVSDLHQRQKRKQFYLDAGMKDLCTEANVFGVNMELLQEQYRDRGLFVEIESTRRAVSDLHQRQKRKQFYLDAGMKDLCTEANVFGVNMELLGSRCELNFDGYRAFYRDNYGSWAADHITRPEQEE